MEWVSPLLEFLFIVGVFVSQGDVVLGILKGLVRKFRRRRRIQWVEVVPKSRKYGRFRTHVAKLLDGTSSLKVFGSVEGFLAVSVLLGIGMYFMVVWQEGAAFSLLPAVFSACFPYLVLRMRLSRLRRLRIREGWEMVQEILAQYRIHNRNMKEAIEAAAESLEKAPFMRSVLVDLANGLNKAYTQAELSEVLDRFRYSIGTAWGNALSTTMYFGHAKGMDVVEALEDLSQSVERSRKVSEQARREQQESNLLLVMVPVIYAWTVFCACRYFRFTLRTFLVGQFHTALGLKCLLITVMLSVAAFACSVFFRGERIGR